MLIIDIHSDFRHLLAQNAIHLFCVHNSFTRRPHETMEIIFFLLHTKGEYERKSSRRSAWNERNDSINSMKIFFKLGIINKIPRREISSHKNMETRREWGEWNHNRVASLNEARNSSGKHLLKKLDDDFSPALHCFCSLPINTNKVQCP